MYKNGHGQLDTNATRWIKERYKNHPAQMEKALKIEAEVEKLETEAKRPKYTTSTKNQIVTIY